MRTTLTIDDDIAVMLDRMRRQRDANLKDVVNEALRRGLQEMGGPPKRRNRFRTRTVSLGRQRIAALDNIAEALAIAEDEAFR
jgi:hypothetical protein